MQLDLFSKTSKRVTKLTDKAKAALEDKLDSSFSKKRKNDISDASAAPDNTKKAKPTQPSGSANVTPPSPPMAARRAVVRTEEEEEAMYDNAIVISDDIEEPRALSPEVESAEDELSTRTIQYGKHFVNKSIERLMKEWLSPVYAFFNPMPCIVDVDGRRAHEFKCSARGCTTTIRRFLDKKDARSTGNMRKHVKSCWGQDVLNGF